MLKKSRKLFLICVLIFSLVVVLGGCSNQPVAAPAKPAAEPIHIGVLGPMTGWATIYGENVVKGVQLALDEVGGKFQDRPIQLFIEDTKVSAETMITKLDSLKQRDNVRIIIGPSLGGEGMAATDWAKRNLDVILMPGYSAPQDMTMRNSSPNIIRAGWTANQVIFHFGQFVAQELKYKKVIVVGQDYAYPWGQAAGFKRGFLENGGEKVETIWHPVEMLDFSSIMVQLQEMAKDYDAVLYNGGGAQAISFWKAWEQFGMSKHYPQLLGGANLPDSSILKEVSDAFVGVYSSMHYVDGNDIPANRKFRDAYMKKYNEVPDAIAVQGYDTMRVILKALEATGGKVDDTEALQKAILAVRIDDSPRGHFYFDERGQAVQNIYIKKVEKVDGELTNVIVKTHKDVCQFGPYANLKDEYMAMPPDSRDYPSGDRETYLKDIAKYLGQDYVDALKRNGGWL